MSGCNTEVSNPGSRNPSIEAAGASGVAGTSALTIDGPITAETSDIQAISFVSGVGLVVAGGNGDGLYQDVVDSEGSVTIENSRDLGSSSDSIGGDAGGGVGTSKGAGNDDPDGTMSGSGVQPFLEVSLAAVPTNAISGFVPGDTIDVTDLTFASITTASLNITTELLTIDYSPGGTSGMLKLTFGGAFTPGESGSVSDGASRNDIGVCFLRGTRILTPIGPAMVESLTIGDRVITHSGGIQEITSIGRLSYESAAAAAYKIPIPIRIRGAVPAEGVQAREPYSSPGHSMLLGDSPVLDSAPIKGGTMSHVMPVDVGQLELYQIELASNDLVLYECAWL